MKELLDGGVPVWVVGTVRVVSMACIMKELLDGGEPVWVVGTIRVVGSEHGMHHEGTLERRCICVGSRHHTCSG